MIGARKIGKYTFNVSEELFRLDGEAINIRINVVVKIYSAWHHFAGERVGMWVNENDLTLVECEYYEA
jgi:hypothetical protein